MRNLIITALAIACLAACRAEQPTAVIVKPLAPSNSVMASLSRSLTNGGYTVRILSFDQALEPDALSNARLVALPDARTLPVAFHEPLETHLLKGGHLVAIGLPGWENPLVKVKGRWMNLNDYALATAWNPPTHRVMDFRRQNTAEWLRAANDLNSQSTYEVVTAGLDRHALHGKVSNLTSWDTIASPVIESPFPAGHDRTVFCAKGGANTRALAVEWIEKDGSRWIATVPLTTKWKRYELAPSAFKYWPSTVGRGGAGDVFKPANAARLTVGLAFSHTGTVSGAHEWWFGNIGTSAVNDAPISAAEAGKWIDGLYPAWKSYTITNPVTVFTAAFPAFVQEARVMDVQGPLRSPHPRPSGAGFGKNRETRVEPLLVAKNKSGVPCGTPGALYIHTDGRYKGGCWALFGVTDAKFLASKTFTDALTRLVQRFDGPWLAEAGSDWSTQFAGEPVTVGAKVVGAITEKTYVKVEIRDWQGHVRRSQAWQNPVNTVSEPWTAGDSALPHRVETTLIERGDVVDRIEHEIHFVETNDHPNYMTTNEGYFTLNGQRWKAHGVNYMPSSGIARDAEDWTSFEYWMDPQAYDSAIIERDLDRVKALGLNSVSVFCYGRSLESGNLLDILRLCLERNLKVNLSLRPGTPMDWDAQWPQIRPIIEEYLLAQNDTIFAYDLAWEPNLGPQRDRTAYDDLWNKWIANRYGSLAKAESAWGWRAERDASGAAVNPSDEQISRDGEWRKMVVDYRDFVGELLKERYGRARRDILSVDPNHLVSFRMSEAGNPTYDGSMFMPYEFPKLAEAVDFLAPEAYGRIGTWDNVKHGMFEVAWARAVAPDKPVVWAEVGVSAWEPGTDYASKQRLKYQAEFFNAFYKMAKESDSDGIFFWWYPGGYRSNEQSDYGIINPDGTDRPSSGVIRRNAPQLTASRKSKTRAKIIINVNPRARADGLFGMYQTVKDEFWDAYNRGFEPVLKIE